MAKFFEIVDAAPVLDEELECGTVCGSCLEGLKGLPGSDIRVVSHTEVQFCTLCGEGDENA